MSDLLRVVIADDHAPTRAMVRGALVEQGCQVVAEAATAAAAVRAAREHAPDVCLLDIHMPGSGIAAAAEITLGLPGIAVVMLTASRDDDDLFDALRAGAAGYLLKDMDPARMGSALRGVLAGEAVLPRWLVAKVVADFRATPQRRLSATARTAMDRLTPREAEVLDLLSVGLSTEDIAARLFVEQVTVRTHVSAILRKPTATATPAVDRTALTHGLGTVTVTCSFTDNGGISDSDTATYTVADTGAPTITASIDPDPADGANDWYTSAPTVTFSCADTGGSGIAGCVAGSGPDAVVTLGEGADRSVTGTATDHAGNTTSVTVDVDVDLSDPTISATVTPAAANGNTGWYVTAPTVTFTCKDNVSGIGTCVADGQTGPSTTLAEGANQNAGGTATDVAGRTATLTVTDLDVDLSDPTISGAVAPAATGTNGWCTTAPTVTFTCEDAVSGIDSCVGDQVLVEGAGQTASGTATDLAGRTETATSDPVDVDLSDPTIAAAVAPTSPDGGNGWYITAPTVTFTCDDAVSGVDTCMADGETGPSTTVTEGAGQTARGTATDVAGRTSAATSDPVDVDLTDPVVVFDAGIGASFVFGSVPAAPTCTATDSGSGVDTDGCVVSGYDTSVGSHTLRATATDNAGRIGSAPQTLTYEVLPWTRSGFYSPVNMGGVWNTVKGGSTVPLKFEVLAGATELIDVAAVASFTTTRVNCLSGQEDAIEQIASTGGTSLRYDSTGGQFIQNWKTPTGAGTCYRATMTTLDGRSITALCRVARGNLTPGLPRNGA